MHAPMQQQFVCPHCRSTVVPTRDTAGQMLCPACRNTGRIQQPAWSPLPPPAQPTPFSPVQPLSSVQPAHGDGMARAPAPGATASMVLGILALVIPYIGFILGFIAMSLGKSALRAAEQAPLRYEGVGMAKAGRIMGIVAVCIYGVLLAIVFMAILFVVLSNMSRVR